jgi:hypothetical protein
MHPFLDLVSLHGHEQVICKISKQDGLGKPMKKAGAIKKGRYGEARVLGKGLAPLVQMEFGHWCRRRER